MADQENEETEPFENPHEVKQLEHCQHDEYHIREGQNGLNCVLAGVVLRPRWSVGLELEKVRNGSFWSTDPEAEIAAGVHRNMSNVGFVPKVLAVIGESAHVILHELIREQEKYGNEAAAVAHYHRSRVFLEDLVEEWHDIEDQVKEEESVLPPSRIPPLEVDEVSEQGLLIEVTRRILLQVNDQLGKVIISEARDWLLNLANGFANLECE